MINLLSPNKSMCSCEYCQAKSCKHKAALFFSIFPEKLSKIREFFNEDYNMYDESLLYEDEENYDDWGDLSDHYYEKFRLNSSKEFD